MGRRVQLVVRHNDDSHSYYTVSPGGGWRIDPARGVLIVGRGMPRTYVPLVNVKDWAVETYHAGGM